MKRVILLQVFLVVIVQAPVGSGKMTLYLQLRIRCSSSCLSLLSGSNEGLADRADHDSSLYNTGSRLYGINHCILSVYGTQLVYSSA